MHDKSIPDLVMQLTDEIKKYLKLRSEYIRLSFGHRFVDLFSGLMVRLILLMLLLFMILFASFAFVYWYGEQTGNYWLAFLINGGVFIVIGLLVYLLRKPLIYDQILKMYLNFSNLEDEELEDEYEE